MNTIWKAKEVPYLLTLLFGALAFQVNTIVENITSTPIIQYDYEIEREEAKGDLTERYVKCSIENISSVTSFKELSFKFRYLSGAKTQIHTPKYRVISPSSIQTIEVNEALNMIVSFKVGHLQPGQKYEFFFTTLGGADDPVFPKLFLDTDETVRLIESSFLTFLGRNYIGINVAFAIIISLIIIIYLSYLSKNKNGTS